MPGWLRDNALAVAMLGVFLCSADRRSRSRSTAAHAHTGD